MPSSQRLIATVLVGAPAAYLLYTHRNAILQSLGITAYNSDDDEPERLASPEGARRHRGEDADVEIAPLLAGVPRDLARLVREYIRYDPRPATTKALRTLVQDATDNHKALEQLFVPRIAFGTAGLRAQMAHGYVRPSCCVEAVCWHGVKVAAVVPMTTVCVHGAKVSAHIRARTAVCVDNTH